MRRLEGWVRCFSTAIAVSAGIAGLAVTGARAEEPKPVTVVNAPTVKAEQQGPWTVTVQGGVSLSGLPAHQPFQSSASLFIDYPDKTWQWTLQVPAGKLLIIEYVSGSFTKIIGSADDATEPPFLFTVTTTAGAQTVSHVMPVRGVKSFANVKSYFQVAAPLRLYAGGGSNVTVKLEHLFSAGYQYDGSMSLSGQLEDVP